MDKFENYIHQLHLAVHLLDKLITEKPEFLKKYLRDIEENKLEMHQKKQKIPLQKTNQQAIAKKFTKSNIHSKKIPIEKAIDFLTTTLEISAL